MGRRVKNRRYRDTTSLKPPIRETIKHMGLPFELCLGSRDWFPALSLTGSCSMSLDQK